MLLTGIPPAFAAAMTRADIRSSQFKLDLVRVNQVKRMAGGEIPLLILLRERGRAAAAARPDRGRVFERILSRTGNNPASYRPPSQLGLAQRIMPSAGLRHMPRTPLHPRAPNPAPVQKMAAQPLRLVGDRRPVRGPSLLSAGS